MQTPPVSRSNASELLPGQRQQLPPTVLLNGITDNVDGYMWVLDKNLEYIIVNVHLRNKIKEVTGKEVAAGSPVIDCIGMLDNSKHIEWDKIYAAGFKGISQKLTQQLTIKQRTTFFEISVNPIKEGAKTIALSCFVKDITEEIVQKQKLRAVEKLFHTFADHATDMIALLNEQGTIMYSSPSFQKTTGFADGDQLTDDVFITHNTTGNIASTPVLTNVLQHDNKALPFPPRFKTKYDTIIWTEGIIINELNIPEVNAVVCSFRDITERKKAEEALQQSELKFRSLIENSTDIITMADINGNIFYGSPSGKKIFGYDEEDYIGKNVCSFIHPECLPAVAELLQNLIAHPNDLFTIDVRAFDKSGAERWVQGIASNMLHVPGINALVGNFRDITERKKAEELLKESEYLYKNLFNKSPLPIWVCDAATTQILEANEAAVQLYGYSRKEFLKMTAFDVMSHDEKNELQLLLPKTIHANRPAVLRKHVKKNKETIFVEVLAHAINYKGNNAWLVLANDITEKIQLQNQLVEEKIKRQQEVAKAVIDAQENERESIGRELHDNISQVLTTARLYLICAKDTPALQSTMIQRSSDTINNAIEEIRRLSRSMIETFHKEVGLKLSLDDLIENITLAKKFLVTLDFSVPNEQELDDKLKMTIFRIIQEQLNNIVKHAEATEVKIFVLQKKHTLLVTLTDNGKGFDIAAKRKGIGITNIISRTELFNGRVKIESSPGNGCKMQVSFNI
jgi:PAS domain S-box-containing protein